MYAVGARVVHPSYGAGTIVQIQEKTIDGSDHEYYVIDVVGGSMQVMVPVQHANRLGLRPVGKLVRLRRALACCCVAPAEEEIERDYRVRHRKMGEQVKSGSFDKVASAVRILFFMGTQRNLGVTDRQTFQRGRDILAGELALASEMDVEEATRRIEDRLAQMLCDVDE